MKRNFVSLALRTDEGYKLRQTAGLASFRETNITLPHVRKNTILRRGFTAPDLGGFELDRIQMLWRLILRLVMYICKNVRSMVPDNLANTTSEVSWQSGM